MRNGALPKIERGVPLPRIKGHKGYVEILLKLKVGDSVFLPINLMAASNAVVRSNLRGKAACRTMKGGTRIWRLK